MPRKARIDAPGAVHHIIVRGIERKPIFRDSADYEGFLDRLDRLIVETSARCYAWALMSNHAHLLLKTGTIPLSTVMRRLLTWYAQRFNRRYHRCGHLFQNRYHSILCEEEPYLLELVRYIHLNPIRAGILSDINELNSYALTGHATVMGNTHRDWQDVDGVLCMFGEQVETARSAYLRFVTSGISQGRRDDLVGGGLVRSLGGWAALKHSRQDGARMMSDERILGSGEFVDSVLSQADEAYEKRTLARAKGLDLEKLVQIVADHLGTDVDSVKSAVKARRASRARGIVCFLARDRLGMKGTEIARTMHLTPSGVSKLSDKGRKDPLSEQMDRLLYEN